MKVKVTWVSNNPFVLDLRNMSRCSEADVPAEMNYDTIEDFAREATPQGFHLRSIDVEGKVVQYDYNGHKLQSPEQAASPELSLPCGSGRLPGSMPGLAQC